MKRMKRIPAEKTRAQYAGYLVKGPMELMDFPAVKIPNASHTKLESLLSKRVILVDDVITTQFNFPLQPGMEMLIDKNENKKEFRYPLLKIIYEDAYIIVIERKESLLSVGIDRRGERTTRHILNEYAGRSGHGSCISVIHRLDRDTSGLMTSVEDEKAQRTLRDYWHNIVTDRRYVTVVTGEMEKDSDTVASRLTDRILYASSGSYNDGGSRSITHYCIIKCANGYSLVELRLKTGYKNQIHVHMQGLEHPLIGDGHYGIDGGPDLPGRLALHVFKLCFYHPITNQLVEFETPYPPAFKKLSLRR